MYVCMCVRVRGDVYTQVPTCMYIQCLWIRWPICMHVCYVIQKTTRVEKVSFPITSYIFMYVIYIYICIRNILGTFF